MSKARVARIPEILAKYESELLAEWTAALARQLGDRRRDAALAGVAREFLSALRNSAQKGELSDTTGQQWASTRSLLEQFTRDRAVQGFTPAETATFVFSFKEPLFARLRTELADDAEALAAETWTANLLLDKL